MLSPSRIIEFQILYFLLYVKGQVKGYALRCPFYDPRPDIIKQSCTLAKTKAATKTSPLGLKLENVYNWWLDETVPSGNIRSHSHCEIGCQKL